ncbi:MAG: transcriptional regulator [Alphaproteobacteria bacterium 32-64-14]|nr:MAG: transcriptional regulator [Alphaproteobacteria bacterium 32-64-14]
MADQNDIIHQATRLKIMSVLNAIPAGEGLEFLRLKAIAHATDGNLGAHLATLEKAGYITIKKDIVGKRTRTRAMITRAGRRAYDAHLLFLRDIIAGQLPDET